MLRWLLVVVVIGCSGSSSSKPSDASPSNDDDATPTITCADGSTLDLDGDGVLSCDDPVESFTIPTPARDVRGAIHRSAVAVLIGETCEIGGICPYTLFAANPQGKVVVRSDSAQPADAWAHRPTLDGPFISRHGQIYVGRREAQTLSDTVSIDPATNTASVRGSPMLNHALRDAYGQPVLGGMTLPPYAMETLVEPQADGSLATLANVNIGFTTYGFNAPLLPTSPSLLVFEKLDLNSKTHIRSFRAGDGQLTELTPPLYGIEQTTVATADGIATCVVTADGLFLYEQDVTGQFSATRLPFRSCVEVKVSVVGSHTLYTGFSEDVNGDGQLGWGVYHRIGNTFEPILVDARGTPRVVGDGFIVVVEERPNAAQPVWIYRTGTAPQLLVSDLQNVDVSISGDIAHVVGMRPTAGFNQANLVVMRVKTGAATQTLDLLQSTSLTTNPVVVTSKEGAAIVSTFARYYIAPSTSFVFGPEIFGAVYGGGVRGANTVLVMGLVMGSLGVYREVGGVPEVALLGSPINGQLTYAPIDSPFAPGSEWFRYAGETMGTCALARIKATAQGPMLENISCPWTARHQVIGTTSDGSLVVAGYEDVVKLSQAGIEPLTGGSRVTPIFDYSKGLRVIGWTVHGVGVCLDGQPRRCWRVPGNTNPIDTVVEFDGSNYQLSQLHVEATQTHATISVVRSIGPGIPSL